MIWHFIEVFGAVLAAFVLGGVIGAFAYAGLARTGFARVQGAVADRVGDVLDGLKMRLGGGPVWTPKIRRNVVQPSPQARFAATALPVHADDARIERRRPGWAEVETGAYNGNGSGYYGANGNGLDDSTEELASAEIALYERDDRPAITPMRPVGLPGPRNGVADDLQRIRGIGRRNEQLLNSLGIFHFGQIAAWTPAEARWVAAFLAFPERIERDDWIGQATILASGGQTGYVKSRRKEADEES